LKSDPAADGFALLTLLVDPEDPPALRYWLGDHVQDCRCRPYARLRDHCERDGQTAKQALENVVAGALTIRHTATLVTRFNELTQHLANLAPLSIAELIDALFPAGNPDADSIRQTALAVAPTVANVSDFLGELRSAIMQPELPGSTGNSIRVMSLYKSKGLTARLVVIVGCVAGILPSTDRSKTPAEQALELEEQRRLFYVGITRATDTLVLSSSTRMPLAMAHRMGMPAFNRGAGGIALFASSFLAELGPTAPAPIRGQLWRQQLGF
jgi:superfamily I DNA/RNA helicase